MDMFVFRVDLAAFSSDEQSIRPQSCVFAAFHAARWEFHPHSRRVRGDQALGAEAAGLGGQRP